MKACNIFLFAVLVASADANSLRGRTSKEHHNGNKNSNDYDYDYDYKCPKYSSRKLGRKSYDSFDDCDCDHGYYKQHGKCVKQHNKKNRRLHFFNRFLSVK